jgi:hypothetical protein
MKLIDKGAQRCDIFCNYAGTNLKEPYNSYLI